MHCVPLTQLIAVRNKSSIKLCRARDTGQHSLWANLNFAHYERKADLSSRMFQSPLLPI